MRNREVQIPTLEEIREASRRIVEQREQVRLLRLPSVLDVVGLSRSEWYRLMSLKRAPLSVPLGERSRAWVESEVLAWARERIAARDTTAA